jgi:hypothetical protein
MSTQLEQFEAERGRLLEIVESSSRQNRYASYFAVPVILVVVVLLISAVFDKQLSLQGLGLATFFSLLIWFILSRQIRSGSRAASFADLVFGTPARVDISYLQAQIAEYDRQIASLKTAKQTSPEQ